MKDTARNPKAQFQTRNFVVVALGLSLACWISAIPAADATEPPAVDVSDKTIEVTDTTIEIRVAIQFAHDDKKISAAGVALIDQLAKALEDAPELTRIEIRGHQASNENDHYAKTVSDHRADAVLEALVERGIDPKRLIVKSYGETYPIDTNRTEAGRANNRRVDFKVLEVDGKPNGPT